MEKIPETAAIPEPQAPEAPTPPVPPTPPAPPVPPKSAEEPKNSPQKTGLPPLEFAPPSTFDGKTIQLIGWNILGVLLTLITLGIGAPWAACMVMRWETKHTYVEGRRLHFDGTGWQMLGNCLLWGLLTGITLGIYALFIPVRMRKWRAKHTRFARVEDQAEGPNAGKIVLIILAVFGALALLAGAFYGIFYVAEQAGWTESTPARGPSSNREDDTPTGNYFVSVSPNGAYQVIVSDDPEASAASEGEDHPASDTPAFFLDTVLVGTWADVDTTMKDFGILRSGALTLCEDGTFVSESYILHGPTGDYNNNGYADWSIAHNDTVTYSGTYTFDGKTLALYYGSVTHYNGNGVVTEGYDRVDVYTAIAYGDGETITLLQEGASQEVTYYRLNNDIDRVIAEYYQ